MRIILHIARDCGFWVISSYQCDELHIITVRVYDYMILSPSISRMDIVSL